MTIIEREYYIQLMGNKNSVIGKTLSLVHEQFINFEFVQRETYEEMLDVYGKLAML